MQKHDNCPYGEIKSGTAGGKRVKIKIAAARIAVPTIVRKLCFSV